MPKCRGFLFYGPSNPILRRCHLPNMRVRNTSEKTYLVQQKQSSKRGTHPHTLTHLVSGGLRIRAQKQNRFLEHAIVLQFVHYAAVKSSAFNLIPRDLPMTTWLSTRHSLFGVLKCHVLRVALGAEIAAFLTWTKEVKRWTYTGGA